MLKSRVLKTAVMALLILPAIGLLIWGPRADESLPPGVVVVDYWEKWTGNEESQMRQIVDAFNSTVGKEKGIFVRYMSTSSVNQKTLTATAAGVPPDIAGIWDLNLAQFASLGALEPLDDLAAKYGITDKTYKDVFWKACNYDGHLYALISTPAAVALHYNKRIFAENAAALRAAGLDPDRPPRSIEELDAYAKALDQKDARGSIIRTGYLPSEPGWFLLYTPLWFGGDIWDAKTHRFTLTSPEVVRAFTWIQSYSKKLGKGATAEFRSGLGTFDSPQNPFLAGTVVMEQQGPWMANYIALQKPQMSTVRWPLDVELTKPLAERLTNYEWAAAPFPTAVPGLKDVSYCGFDALAIPRGAKHKNEAFEFIAYVQRQDVMERLCKLHCKNSPLRNVSDDFLNHHPNPYISVFEDLANSPNAHAAPELPILPEVLSEMDNLVQQLVLLEVTPQQGLALAQERLQAKYDDFVAERQARRGMESEHGSASQ